MISLKVIYGSRKSRDAKEILGSARALACCLLRPRGKPLQIPCFSLMLRSRPAIGEGANRHTRGRVCSPELQPH